MENSAMQERCSRGWDRASGDGVERWGLFLGLALLTLAFIAAGVTLYWLKGLALWAGTALFALLFWCAILSVRAFDRTSA